MPSLEKGSLNATLPQLGATAAAGQVLGAVQALGQHLVASRLATKAFSRAVVGLCEAVGNTCTVLLTKTNSFGWPQATE